MINRRSVTRRYSSLPLASVAILAGLASGCSRDRAAAGTGTAIVPLDSALEWQRELTLEENDSTINVVVRAALDPHGGFLIADEREGFVRRYGPEGRLLAQFGGKGNGPAEFPNVLSAVRLPNGSIAAFDIEYRVAVFDSTGGRVLQTYRTPIGHLHAVIALDDSLFLLGGQITGDERDQRLHIWNMAADSVTSSFFAPPLPSEAHVVAARAAGWVGFDRRGDTLAVVTSLSDTLYLMTVQGRMLERIPIPSTALRRLDPDMALPTGRGSIGEARKWISSFSLIADVHWIGDTFVVQYQDRLRPEPDWSLIGMTREGRRTFESVDTPKLLASDQDDRLLYLVSPESDTPNVWRAARLRDR